MKRVLVVGAGFGGLQVVKALARQDNVEVLLLDRQNYHLFHPLLYQVATAGLEKENIAYPIRAIIRKWPNVRFLMTEVREVDLDRRELLTDSGSFDYDYLVLAPGSVTNFYGLASVEREAHDLKYLGEATALRNHILSVFEQASQEPDPEVRAGLMTFVIVGAGPTGVEFSGALAELVHHALLKDYPELNVRNTRIVLVEALDQILPMFPPSLQEYARHRLERLGVEIRLQSPVVDVKPGYVLLKDGSSIPSYTLFWAAGVKASPLADAIPVNKARGGRIPVLPDMTIAGHPEVFVIGDMAYIEQNGSALPMLAPIAMQEGRYVGQVILRREQGQSVDPFHYKDRGFMAIIGRYTAVARAFGVNLTGFVAWVAWLALHLYYLIGFRNRLMALLNWGYAYLLLDPKLRLITQEGKEHIVHRETLESRY